MSQIRLSSILQRPINKDHWPHLQNIIKALQQFITVKAKNRQYLQAQKAKQKIIECQDQIRQRNHHNLHLREQQALQQLYQSHQEQRIKLDKEWDHRKRKIQKEYSDILDKKIQKYQLEKEKYLQQLEIALPLNNSPDKAIYHLKHQQEAAAQCGDFEKAQKIKMQIMKKEMQLSKKYQKLRETNIKTMMSEQQQKQSNEVLIIEARRDQKLMQNERNRQKRVKELTNKQERQGKELIWIYNEQIKKMK